MLLSKSGEQYSSTYNSFSASGVYTVAVYALDISGVVSLPNVTRVIKDVDDYEVDDTPDQAKPIVVNSGLTQYHNFLNTNDVVDWVKFYGMPGTGSQLYEIEVLNRGSNCREILALYGPNDANALIKQVDNGMLSFTCTQEGMYYVKIYQADGKTYGMYTNYELKVYNSNAPVLGLIKGSIKDTGGSPMLNAVITTDYGYSALSSNGSYEMPHKDGGPFTLKAEAAGYEQYSHPGINLEARGTLQLDIVMTPVGGTTTTTIVSGGSTTTVIVPGGSTTTTTAKKCPLRKALGDESEAELEALRIFRDKRLNQSAEGAQLVGMYYRHATELTMMFEKRPDIEAQVRELVLELLPQLGEQQKIVLSNDMKQQLFDLIEQIRTEASPGLKKSLRLVRKQIEKGELELK